MGNTKAIWKIINQLTHKKVTSNSSVNELKVNAHSITDPLED